LDWIGTALKVVAWVVLVLGLIGGIGAMIAGQQAGEEAAQRGLEATGMGVVGTGVTAGIIAIVMAAVWFLILYALAEIGQTVKDIWVSRVSVGETVSAARREAAPATSPDYETRRVPPPAGAPS
jgi:hypothetical protein